MTKTLLILAVSTLLAVSLHAQKKKEAAANNDSSFNSESRLVVVDSVVTDKKGAYIGDLAQKDFKLREDGKAQAITGFSNVAEGASDDQKCYLVLVFDNPTMPQVDQHYAREIATKFIGTKLEANRFVAVVEFDGALRVTQNLTNDVVRLNVAVNAARPAVTSGGAGGIVINSPAAKAPSGALPEAVRSLARGLARLPGRKTVILFSEGLSVSHDVMQSAIDESNRANAAVYPVDIAALANRSSPGAVVADASFGRAPAGLQSSVSGQVMAQGISRQTAAGDLSAPPAASDALFELAKGTGGFVISSSSRLPEDLNRIAREERQYYVLAYQPVMELRQGACHSLKVQTDRSGANVRSRTSYCDVDTPEVQDGTPTQRDLEARLNANEASTVHATMQTPFFYVAANTVRVDMALEIPGAGVKFVREKGKFVATLNVIGIASLPDGDVAARFNDTAKVMLDDQSQVEEFASRPYRFEKQFELASGTFDLKVAFSSGAASFGVVETQLTIDPWEPSKFLLSGLALSQATRPATAVALGEVDLYGDKVPLNANGVQFIPAGTNRFQKSQRAFIYAEIYEPGDSGTSLEVNIHNASTGELVKRMGPSDVRPEIVPGTSAIPFGLILPVAELPPGSYTVQIDARDTASNHSTRKTGFEVTP